jgi:hypothetical protein
MFGHDSHVGQQIYVHFHQGAAIFFKKALILEQASRLFINTILIINNL